MISRYVIRTIDQDWIDPFEEPSLVDDKRTAWNEAKRRRCDYPDCKTVVIDRHNGRVLWESDPAIPAQYELLSVTRYPFYETDPYEKLPMHILSTHKDKDAALTAFHDAIETPRDDILLVRDTGPLSDVIANSVDYTPASPA